MLTIKYTMESRNRSSLTLSNSNGQRTAKVLKRTKNPYLNFTQDFLANFSGEAVSQQTKICEAGERWRTMTDEEKQPYIEMAEKARRKRDMEHQRAVSLESQTKFANEYGIQSTHCVSARTGENVMLAFQKVLAESMGLRLSRVEQEEQQSVVKAEILAPNHNQAYAVVHTPPSTICSLQ